MKYRLSSNSNDDGKSEYTQIQKVIDGISRQNSQIQVGLMVALENIEHHW